MGTVRDLSTGNLTLKVERPSGAERDRVRVFWVGKSDARQPSMPLAPFFESLTAEVEAESKFLEFHFEALEHLNSATMYVVMQLIQSLRRKHTRLVIFYDERQKWQKTTFDVLRHMDKKDGLLELRGDPR